MRAIRYAVFAIVALGFAGCQDPLNVSNTNNPDRNKALGTAADLESFLSQAYTVVHQGTLGGATVPGGGANDGLETQLLTAGMESVSGLANFAMGPRSALPRNPIDNSIGGQGSQGNYRDFVVEHRAAFMAALSLVKLKDLGTLGSPARDARARAFARFVQGVALGDLALAYDSAIVITENNTAAPIVPLSHYDSVGRAALSYLDSAIAIATAAPVASDGFPIPNTWINGVSLSVAQFIRLARSYKARFRADVARTPAERALVNWTSVIADATNGITSNFDITMVPPPSGAWDISWVPQQFATGSANWHQMSQFFMGMADTSGGYDQWLSRAMPVCGRCQFLVVTPDKRFPSGTTRALQNASSPASNIKAPFDSIIPYVRNRPAGEDQPGDPLQISMYDNYRSRGFFNSNDFGAYPVMTASEMRLLAAEGNLRTNNIGQAARLINVSRVGVAGLPPLDTLALDTLAAVPGGTACVPRVPDPAQGYAKSKCGNIWDALKWEYRMETMYAGYGKWFFAARGWGDLPEGTAIHWPVPYQELQVRGEPIYGLGGVGQVGGAAKGNYGLFSGGVY
jgi:hypothetical protein